MSPLRTPSFSTSVSLSTGGFLLIAAVVIWAVAGRGVPDSVAEQSAATQQDEEDLQKYHLAPHAPATRSDDTPPTTRVAFAQNETPLGMDTSHLMGSPDPLPLEAERVFPNLHFDRPLEILGAGDGSNRLFVVEQAGRVLVFPNRPDVTQPKVFLDIREVVSRDHNEEGLLGLAFHPNYAENGRFFVYYSVRPRASIVAEFRVSGDDPDRADRRSERVLMHIDQPYGNHNGGCIRFGPDGYLYISLGDGGAANDPHGNGQDLSTLLGSILRIDVDRRDPGLAYAIPDDNPFVNQPGARGEIWAYGLRNVWRMSFDRETGRLFGGDVGQNRYEEVDLIVRGGNYGWKIREGFHSFAPDAEQTGDRLIDPLAEYFRHEGLSVTGGVVYRGQRLPEYDGAYFYADYVAGNVWIVRVDEAGNVTEQRMVARTGLPISSFGEDDAGEMYFTAFDGHLYRFRPAPEELLATADVFPRRLSQTGIFASLDTLTPAEGVLTYDVNVPLWSDGAMKTRRIVLPPNGRIGFHPRETWRLPVGTVLVKSFFLPQSMAAAQLAAEHPRRAAGELHRRDRWRRLETRLLIHSSRGWEGYTYRWNEAQTEAVLLDDALREEIDTALPNGEPNTQTWYYPSRSDCMACHTPAADFVLGVETRQLNRPSPTGTGNQIDYFAERGAFSGAIPAAHTLESYPDWFAAERVSKEELARAYLDANCAFCHQPGAIVSHPNLRYDTPLSEANLIGRNPGQGGLGPPDSKLVTPGDPRRSELLHRLDHRGARQMPPLASEEVDPLAVKRITDWIRELD